MHKLRNHSLSRLGKGLQQYQNTVSCQLRKGGILKRTVAVTMTAFSVLNLNLSNTASSQLLPRSFEAKSICFVVDIDLRVIGLLKTATIAGAVPKSGAETEDIAQWVHLVGFGFPFRHGIIISVPNTPVFRRACPS